MNLANLLMRIAKRLPERPALAHGNRELYSYRELAHRVCTLSGALRDRFALRHGDRVGLFMHNCPEYLEILYAVWHAGLVAVPINAKLHPKEVQFILDDAGVSLLFVADDLDVPTLAEVVSVASAQYRALFAAGAQAAMGPYTPGDLAWLFYTSGTTGKPKGVMLTHDNLLAMTQCYFTDVDTVTMNDSTLYAAPMSHGAGLYNLPHVLAGARHVVPESGGFAAEEIIELGRRYGKLSMFAAPTMVRRLVDHCASHGCDAQGIKTIVYGGGPMYVEDIRRALQVMGQRFVQIYGQGETPMTITALSKFHLAQTEHARYLELLGSVGVAQSAVEVRVVDADGSDVSPGESGEVIVRGPTVMRGYWNNPGATAQALRDGWLYTGDVGAFDDDGFLTLKDRSKDIIISGGSNIYPREVEEVLLMHPAVAEVSVVGRPSAEWGEEVVAFVVCAEGKSVATDELDALCLAHIARFKRPKEYRVVPALPKNNYGKVLKTELRQALASK
ncbi:AMP-binding protein [Noviherbaspirillum sp.]|uniref:AMP-binding protein n=1 Tax=Noviherbaspirillum sp. TaxID=1926288 RepID=UPI0025DAEF58|nr:AMP-binding protein [Noviherbaspirillum sp.]